MMRSSVLPTATIEEVSIDTGIGRRAESANIACPANEPARCASRCCRHGGGIGRGASARLRSAY